MEHVTSNASLEQSADPNPQSGAAEPFPAEAAEIEALEEEPTEELPLIRLTEQPSQVFRGESCEDVVEPLVLRGWVEAPRRSRALLEHYGIDLREACYDRKTHRWSDCLFSEPVADLLKELTPKGEFPFRFEATPLTPESAERTRRGNPLEAK